MTDTVTQVTMWQDATGYAWPTQEQAINANSLNDMSTYIQGAIASGNPNAQSLSGLAPGQINQLAALILAGYTVTPIA